MAINERQNEILRTLKESKTASVNALAKALYVSEATIRRDLAEMKSRGLIESISASLWYCVDLR